MMEKSDRLKADAQPQLIGAESFHYLNLNIMNMPDRGGAILFDDQSHFPQTPVKTDCSRLDTTTWQPSWSAVYGTPCFYIDLGAYYIITDIGLFDTYGSPELTIAQGTPDSFQVIGTKVLNSYKQYSSVHNDIQKPVRYLKFTSSEVQTGLSEVALYGYYAGELTNEDLKRTGKKPVSEKQDPLTAGDKIGANAFADDPFVSLSALGNIREYYSWNWSVTWNNQFDFNGTLNHDSYYKTLQEMGIDVIPCIQYTSESLAGNNVDFNSVRNGAPVEQGADRCNPLSYELHSSFMYNFAARYGNNSSVSKESLSTADSCESLTGLGYLDTVEAWNEPNKTWGNQEDYMAPEELAALLSADWDGHEGKIANGGVKTADPNFKLIMGGLWWSNDNDIINYLDRMKLWFDYNRSDGVFCSDAINVHIYLEKGDTPEQGIWLERIALVQDWIQENVPGLELWISEFDVNVTQYEQEGVDNHVNQEYTKKRAEQLLRAYLTGDRYGADRLSMFMIRDTYSGIYYNSGLTTGKGEWDKKLSWYYISCASEVLKHADFVRKIETDRVYIYEYKDRQSSEIIYAVWSPTTDGRSIEEYQLKTGDFEKAVLIRPADALKEGEKTSLTIQNGSVTVPVSETVSFVKVSDGDVEGEHFPQRRIEPLSIQLGVLHGTPDTLLFDASEVVSLSMKPSDSNFMLNQFYHLFDEQDESMTPKTPWVITRDKPVTEMGALPIYRERAYPYDAIVELDDYYDITYIGLYDSYSTGKMEIYDANTDRLLFSTELNSYNQWVLNPLTEEPVSTNRLRIVKYNEAKLNELVFYGYLSSVRVNSQTVSFL